MAYDLFYQNLGIPNGREYIAGMAGRLGMDKAKIERQLNQESGGKSSATSPVGAVGVSQMMPNTIAGLRRNYPEKNLGNPRDPVESLKMYEALMAENIKRTGGDVDHAVRAYHGGWDPKNWGPVNADYINIVNGRKTKLGGEGVQIKPTAMKQMDMMQAYQRGVGAHQPGNNFGSSPVWEQFNQAMPEVSGRDFTRNPITLESIMGMLGEQYV